MRHFPGQIVDWRLFDSLCILGILCLSRLVVLCRACGAYVDGAGGEGGLFSRFAGSMVRLTCQGDTVC